MWTRFMDMHSGGGTKEAPYEYIFIEASEEEAKVIFYNKFGHNPERVTCTCCGDDYSIEDGEELSQLTGYDRGCASGYVMDDGTIHDNNIWNKTPIKDRAELGKHFRYLERKDESEYDYREYKTVEEYLKDKKVLVISEADINPEWRTGDVPQQGYVWQD